MPVRPSTRQADRKRVGDFAEQLVSDRLRADGYEVVGRNVRVGRLEIDIIARRGRLLVFCEVRARAGTSWVAPHHTIDRGKAERVRAAAAEWLRRQEERPGEIRLDVASVVLGNGAGSPATIDYFEGAL